MTIKIQSKKFLEDYTITAQANAGTDLNIDPNPAEFDRVKHQISAEYRPIILNYTDQSWNWDLSSHLHGVSVAPLPSSAPKTEKERKEAEEEARANRAKWLGFLIAGISAFLTGKTWTSYRRYTNTFSYTQKVHQAVTEYLSQEQKPEVYSDFKSLVDRQLKVDSLNAGKAKSYFLAALGTFIGGGVLAVGGFAVIPWVITAGQVILVVSVTFALFNLGVHWDDKATIRQHNQEIVKLANQILVMLLACDDDMNLASWSAPQPSFVPIYPNPQVNATAPFFGT